MVALAQHVWYDMIKAGEIKQNNKDRNNDSSTSCPRGAYRGRDRGGFQNRGRGDRGRGRGGFQSRRQDSRTTYTPWEDNKYPTGHNDKGEPCCYKCGSTLHFVYDCDGSGPVKQEKENDRGFTPRTQLSRAGAGNRPRSRGDSS